jgi:hypothetical protein
MLEELLGDPRQEAEGRFPGSGDSRAKASPGPGGSLRGGQRPQHVLGNPGERSFTLAASYQDC